MQSCRGDVLLMIRGSSTGDRISATNQILAPIGIHQRGVLGTRNSAFAHAAFQFILFSCPDGKELASNAGASQMITSIELDKDRKLALTQDQATAARATLEQQIRLALATGLRNLGLR